LSSVSRKDVLMIVLGLVALLVGLLSLGVAVASHASGAPPYQTWALIGFGGKLLASLRDSHPSCQQSRRAHRGNAFVSGSFLICAAILFLLEPSAQMSIICFYLGQKLGSLPLSAICPPFRFGTSPEDLPLYHDAALKGLCAMILSAFFLAVTEGAFQIGIGLISGVALTLLVQEITYNLVMWQRLPREES